MKKLLLNSLAILSVFLAIPFAGTIDTACFVRPLNTEIVENCNVTYTDSVLTKGKAAPLSMFYRTLNDSGLVALTGHNVAYYKAQMKGWVESHGTISQLPPGTPVRPRPDSTRSH